ncbi:MAG: class I SAM-dependent methyltransferase [Bdellovibrionales bacterium]|nr:class I SAM-dependent methyltransferase [Bdellovibrionales bacterium]
MAHKNKSNWSPMKSRRGRHDNPSARGHVKANESFSEPEAYERLSSHLYHHGITDLSPQQLKILTQFYFLLIQGQDRQNFTRLVSLRDIAIKHFVDCLIVDKHVRLQFPLLDIGTGPGFPGIPLKILYPDQHIFLAEGVQKRVEFLKTVREKLNLQHLDIIGRNIGEDFFYPVRGVITRAVEDVRNTLSKVLYSLQTGGDVFFMKGPNCDPEIVEFEKSSLTEFYSLQNDVAYRIPETPHERRLLVFRKCKAPPLANLDAVLEAELSQDDGLD